MKKTRRILSLVLTLCLLGTLLSGICLTASAEDGFTVTFSVPDGVTTPEALTGTSITLPTAATPNGNYQFEGWSATEITDTTTDATVLTGTYAPSADVTLYAIYSLRSAANGYAKVTAEPESWEGQYLIVSDDYGYIFRGTMGYVKTNYYNDVSISNGFIAYDTKLETELVTIAPEGEGNYTMKLSNGKYFGWLGSNNNGINSSASTKYQNTFTWLGGGYVQIQNAEATNTNTTNLINSFVYNKASTADRFAYYKSSTTATNVFYPSLYKKTVSSLTYTTNVPACEHNNELTDTVKATCTTDAVAIYTCSACGLVTNEIQEGTALGHSLVGEATVTKAPTCTAAGSQKRLCENCNKQITEVIPANGHSFENNLCTVCGEIDPIDPVTKTFTRVTSAEQLGEGEYILIAKAYIKPAAEPEEGEEPEEPVSFNADYYALKNEVGKPIHNMKAYDADGLIGESIPATLTIDEETIQWYGTIENDTLSLRGYNGWDLIADENNLDFTLPVQGSAPTAWTPTFDAEDCTFQLTYLDEGDNTRIMGLRSDLAPDEDGDPHFKCVNISTLGKTINSSFRFYLYFKAEDCEHSYVTKTTPAACETTGFDTNYCVLCGRTNINSFTEAIGHTPTLDENGDPAITVVEPTCTEIGTNTYVCANCGKTQKEEVPALGHTYENGVCTVCGAEEPVMQDFTRITSLDDLEDGHYVLVAKGANKPGWYALQQLTYKTSYVAAKNVGDLFEDDIVPDSISLSDTAVIWNVTVTDGAITLTGEDSNSLTTTKSNYLYYDEADASTWTVEATANGTFKLTTTDTEEKARILGIRDDLATTMADATPLFRCNAPSDAKAKTSSYEFYLYSDSVNAEFKITSASLRLDEDIDVIYKATVPTGYTDVSMTFTMNGESVTAEDDGTHTFVFEGVNPQCIGDNISATLTATCDDEQFSDEIAEYSVRKYCVNKLADATISADLRTLLSDVLAYGAAAQIYMSYNTDALVTAGDDIANPTYSTYTQIEGYAPAFSGEAAESPAWTGAYLTLTNSVAMTFRFYAESIEGLSVTVSVNGREETFNEFADCGNSIYEVSFSGIKATEFGDAVSASFSTGGNTVSYSVNAYVCAKQADANSNLAALVKALYNYGAAAEAYAK